MDKQLHLEKDRGKRSHGWLQSNFSFSFADYYNPEKMGFGALRVLNDDIIAPGKGFPTHPHENMEIITIPLSGRVAHKDSSGGEGSIGPGEVQVMSAGKGLVHSEFNPSETEELSLFQLWITPKEENITPRYAEKKFSFIPNELTILASGKEGEGLYIHQDAKLSWGEFDAGKSLDYAIGKEKGVFFMVVEGNVEIAGELLGKRDAIAVSETEQILVLFKEKTTLLVITVPL